MKAIILAGGFATRLYPITLDTPKPLLEVKNKPIIDWIIEKIKELPIDQIIVVTNHTFYNQFVEWGRNKKVTIIDDGGNSESLKRGAMGGLFFAIDKEKINEDFLVVSGDSLFKFSLIEPYSLFKKEDKDLAIFYNVKNINEAKRLGVALIKNNLLIDFQEKPDEPKSTLCFTTVCFHKKETIPYLKEFVKTHLDQPGRFLQYLYQKVPVFGFVTEKEYVDIGTLEAFERAKKDF